MYLTQLGPGKLKFHQEECHPHGDRVYKCCILNPGIQKDCSEASVRTESKRCAINCRSTPCSKMLYKKHMCNIWYQYYIIYNIYQCNGNPTTPEICVWSNTETPESWNLIHIFTCQGSNGRTSVARLPSNIIQLHIFVYLYLYAINPS